MFDEECANVVNHTTNKMNFCQNDKEMQYKLLLNIIPKKGFKKIEYIKKSVNQ